MFKLKQHLVGIAVAVAGLASAVAAPSISFVTSGNKADVVVGNLGGNIVAAYDLDVQFDSSVITFTSLTFGTLLGGPADSSQGFVDPIVGNIVDMFEVSYLSDAQLAAVQDGNSVLLATLEFNGNDLSSLQFVNWGTNGDVTNDVKGADNRVLIPGSDLPEPSTYALVALALAGVLVTGRRRVRRERK